MLQKHDLSQFTGTENWTRWSPLFPDMVLTDGALHVAENGGGQGAFWLMDAVASYQRDLRRKYQWAKEAQFWKLTVKDNKATLECRQDSGEEPVVRQEIEYTDFDLEEISLWVMPLGDTAAHYTIMLPSEY